MFSFLSRVLGTPMFMEIFSVAFFCIREIFQHNIIFKRAGGSECFTFSKKCHWDTVGMGGGQTVMKVGKASNFPLLSQRHPAIGGWSSQPHRRTWRCLQAAVWPPPRVPPAGYSAQCTLSGKSCLLQVKDGVAPSLSPARRRECCRETDEVIHYQVGKR